MKPASERADEYRTQVEAYLTHIKLLKQWSQSEIARQADIHPSAINKAFAKKHSLGWDVIENLAERSGVPIPQSLRTTYRLRRQRREQQEVDAFLERSPDWRRLLEIVAAIDAEKDEVRRRALEKERAELLAKVS